MTGSLCLGRHRQGLRIKHKLRLRHEPSFSVVKSETTWPHPEDLTFRAKKQTNKQTKKQQHIICQNKLKVEIFPNVLGSRGMQCISSLGVRFQSFFFSLWNWPRTRADLAGVCFQSYFFSLWNWPRTRAGLAGVRFQSFFFSLWNWPRTRADLAGVRFQSFFFSLWNWPRTRADLAQLHDVSDRAGRK